MRITEQLLRKKAEHNEGMLSNLEEVALHQLEIEKIEMFDKLCRHIQILLLQNNLIEKMENLNKLKELKYLNLALNNISIIEGLENSESLEKIDFTCNFITGATYLRSIWNLKKCASIREIYLTGNPCTDFPKYRELLVAVVDQLNIIDGKEVLPSERIQSKQVYEPNVVLLEEFAQMQADKEAQLTKEERDRAYTKEYRRNMYLDNSKNKEEEIKKEHLIKPKISTQFLPNGEMRQCNEGKYEFGLKEYEDALFTTFSIKVPKFMDTSLVKAEVYPFFVSVRIKDKLTQIKLWEEVKTTPVSVQRSAVTGDLVIKLEKMKYDQVLARKLKLEQGKSKDKEANPNTSEIDKQTTEDVCDDVPDLE